jgi:CDP-diacylglycerol--glycerol-3-phosphate 3-phosphatidyltransferase
MKLAIVELIKKDQHLFGLPNLLSLTRLLFLPFIGYAITLQSMSGNVLAFVIYAISAWTDFFDGYVARRRNQFSELGRILDPVIDKIYVAVLMLLLAAYRELPYWYLGVVIGRDLLILFGSLLVISKKHTVYESIYIGKVTLVLYLFVILAYLLYLSPFDLIFLWVSIAFIPVSFYKYVEVYRKVRRTESMTEL